MLQAMGSLLRSPSGIAEFSGALRSSKVAETCIKAKPHIAGKPQGGQVRALLCKLPCKAHKPQDCACVQQIGSLLSSASGMAAFADALKSRKV